MRTRKVGRWSVRLAVVSALGVLALMQTPVADAAVDTGVKVVTNVDDLLTPDSEPAPQPSPSAPAADNEGWEWT